MGIIGWIVLGLLAGIIAKSIFPGAERLGVIMTTLLGSAAPCSAVSSHRSSASAIRLTSSST
jgi:uncharacterized membrane protein YeaQ/YmgE (transglycosylase-associated protein family)